jgi:site-specific DNA recombinase
MPYAPEYLHLVIPGVQFEADLYGRNSDDTTGTGDSVKDQLDAGRALCRDHNWRVRREFDDTDTSASRHGRKVRDDFEALIASMAEEPPPPGTRRIVVAYEASRYYRDLEAYVRLRAACMATDTLLCYNGQVYDLSRRDDRKATAQHAIDAEDEADGIRDRNLRTMRRTAAEGMPHGRSIYGYIRTYEMVNGRKRCTGQVEDPVRGPYIVQALQRMDAGHTLRAVARWLRSEPDAARLDGFEWNEQSLRLMLRNRAYIGERAHQGTYTPAVWAPIKGLETPQGRAMFNRVSALLADPSRLKHRGTAPKHLLSYVALCGECGDHAFLRYLAPSGVRKTTLVCKEKFDTSIVMATLDAYVEEAVIDWFSDKTRARTALVPADDKVKEAAAATQRLINAYEEQLAEARALSQEFDEGTGRFKLSAASLAAMEARLEPKLEAERKKLTQFAGVSPLLLQMLESSDPDLVWNGRPESEGQAAMPGLTIDQKREVIRKVVTVRLYKVKSTGRRRLDDGRVGLSFVGEPGFRERRLRAPESVPVRDGAAGGPGAV